MHPLRRGAVAAVATGLEPRVPRVARPLDQGRQGVEQRRLRKTPPFQYADAARPRCQRERRLPHAGKLRDDDAGVGERDDDLGRFAGRELHRAVAGFLPFDRRRQI